MKSIVLILVLIPALVSAKKCTNPTNQPNTNEPTTKQPITNEPTTKQQTTTEEETTEPPTTQTTEPDTTTPFFPPPEFWPKGRFALMRAGPDCPDFRGLKKGVRYQDSEDFRNGNFWSNADGFSGRMKSDGYEMHYCSKGSNKGVGSWPSGNYCIHRYGRKCPSGFSNGNITWDDENSGNMNSIKGRLPAGIYGEDTTQYFCCRDDGNVNSGMSLPVTTPFFLYRYTGEQCQKVRGMTSTELIVLYDDEDTENTDAKGGAHPYDSGNIANHRLHFCLYEAK